MSRGLTPRQIEERRGFVGASDARTIMSDDPEAILKLWRVKRGEEEPDDLRWVLPVQMGLVTEALNAEWFEYTTGRKLTRIQEEVMSFDHPWMTATLDGEDADHPEGRTAVDCKHVNAYSKVEDIYQNYFPQMTHTMVITGARRACLSVFIGTLRHEIIDIPWDADYAAQLIAAERYFIECVRNGTPPVPVEVKVPVVPTVKIDMTGSNEWGDAAGRWSSNQAFAKNFDKAKADLKKLMPDEAIEAYGHGIVVSRSKSNSLTIKEMK